MNAKHRAEHRVRTIQFKKNILAKIDIQVINYSIYNTKAQYISIESRLKWHEKIIKVEIKHTKTLGDEYYER